MEKAEPVAQHLRASETTFTEEPTPKSYVEALHCKPWIGSLYGLQNIPQLRGVNSCGTAGTRSRKQDGSLAQQIRRAAVAAEAEDVSQQHVQV